MKRPSLLVAAVLALVVASGIVCFISLRGTYTSLEASRSAYYDRYRFADVFARVESAPPMQTLEHSCADRARRDEHEH